MEIDIKNIWKKYKHYLYSVILLLLSIFITISCFSYHYQDPSFSRSSNASVVNILGCYGSYLADFLLQFLGFSTILLILSFVRWSYQFAKYSQVSYLLIRFMLLIFSIISASTLLSKNTDNIIYLNGFKSAGGYLGVYFNSLLKSFSIQQLYLYISLIVLFITSYFYTLNISLKCYIDFTVRIYQFFRKILMICFFTCFILSFPIRKIKNKNALLFPKRNIKHNAKKISKAKPQKNRNKSTSLDSSYNLPEINILTLPDKAKKNLNGLDIEKNIENLQRVLTEFGVKGNIIDAHSGPVVTLYEFEPVAGTKSSRVIGLADDIARSMKAKSSRIAVIPGRNAIGIELPNPHRETILIREMLESKEYENEKHSLPLALGKDIAGKPVIANLAKMPHLLVAGTTGSGKSVSINTMLLSILYSKTPEQCKLILIDPKMLELSVYEGIPHLLTPVVTEPKKAIVALKWVVKEMEERYRLMSTLSVRNIGNYNNKIAEAKKNNIDLSRNVQTGYDPETGAPIFEKLPIEKKELPQIVVVVDEMADLMLVAGKEIEVSIQRLSQMARAAGIHIIMATQRPSVDVITGVIKANFPTRISFQVTSKIDSRTVLGEQGAEQLLGMGDMLYMGNGSKVIRIHAPYVSDDEVRNVVSQLKKQGTPEYINDVTVVEDDNQPMMQPGKSSGGDDLYDEALRIVLKDKKASTSYIQRCLRIGYNRAANIIERMEREGVVSSANAVGKREILLGDNNS